MAASAAKAKKSIHHLSKATRTALGQHGADEWSPGFAMCPMTWRCRSRKPWHRHPARDTDPPLI
jgi:hypothetical protein